MIIATRLPTAFLLFLAISAAFLIGGARAVDGATSLEDDIQRPSSPSLSLAIVATASKEWPILSGDQVSVVLTNTSTKTVRVWSEGCSWGWSQLSFETRDASGMIHTCAKLEREWRKNVPKVDTLEPGQRLTISAAVTDPALWNPIMGNSAPGTATTLRAVFASSAINDAPIAEVWAGRVDSPWIEYSVAMCEPKPHEGPAAAPRYRIKQLPELSGD